MSWSQNNPSPLDYGSMSVMDTDLSFILDCTANMTARGDIIVSVGTPNVQRTDGQTLTADDLTVSDVEVEAGGLLFGWSMAANGNVAVYIVNFPITLQSGSVLWRAIRIATLPAIG